MTPPKPKKVWKIQVNEEGQFQLVDELGVIRSRDQSRMKMFEHATKHGADEVKHDYDCVKYST